MAKPFKNGKKMEKFRDKRGRFLPGYPGGPGRPKGKRNFKTDFEEAVRKSLGENPRKIYVEILKRGIMEALKGKFPFFKLIVDRIYGKIPGEVKKREEIKAIRDFEEFLRKFIEAKKMEN